MISVQRFPVFLAACMTAGGYLFHWFFLAGWGVFAAAATALVVIAPMGLGLRALEDRILKRHSRASDWQGIAVGFGMLAVVQGACAIAFGSGGRSFEIDREVVALAGARATDVNLSCLLVSCLACCSLVLLFQGSIIGLRFRALRSSPELSEVCGLNVPFLRSLGIVLSILFSVFGMELLVIDSGVTLSVGFSALMTGATASLLGGGTSLTGALAGALGITFLRNLIAFKFGIVWAEPVTFLVLVGALMMLPHGLSGQRGRDIRV